MVQKASPKRTKRSFSQSQSHPNNQKYFRPFWMRRGASLWRSNFSNVNGGASTRPVRPAAIWTCTKCLASAPEHLCPCGSGNRFDACHKPNGETLFAAIHEIGHAVVLPANSGHLLWEANWAISLRCTLSSIRLTLQTCKFLPSWAFFRDTATLFVS
jgi:hypothetical protein